MPQTLRVRGSHRAPCSMTSPSPLPPRRICADVFSVSAAAALLFFASALLLAVDFARSEPLEMEASGASVVFTASGNGAKILESPLYERPRISSAPLAPPARILMGPGPSTPHPRVLEATSLPLLGHMHPEFLSVMDDVREWLKYAFQTSNPFTLAVSGSGHAAMEASVASVVEKGDIVMVGVNGIWGERMSILARRYGADVRLIETEPGSVFSYEAIEKGLKENPGVRVLFLVHGESSTGTLQPLEGLGQLCKAYGVLLFVDAVCTLGGVPLHTDGHGIDIVYSGSQKCLGAPVAPSPLTLSPAAVAKMRNRTSEIASYYFDMNLVGEYWGVEGGPRKYHHTGMVSNMYSLREALAMLAEEGMESLWKRHLTAAEQLWEGLERLGLEFFVKEKSSRLPTVTTVKVPEGIQWSSVTGYLMKKYSLEIAGGLGPTAGKVWRIGVMGFNAKPGNVALLLHALEDALTHFGYRNTSSSSTSA